MIQFLRRNVGTIIASIGFLLLTILTFGNIMEIMTDEYWQNVKANLTAIGFTTISLTMIQVTIKQGLGEQALQRGLNAPQAEAAYTSHRDLVHSCIEKTRYLPYFLLAYNKRETLLAQRNFLCANGYTCEEALLTSTDKNMIRTYKKIRIQIRAKDIHWSASEIKYDKLGRIETLAEHRIKRASIGAVSALVSMIALTFLTRGIFFESSGTSLGEKFLRLGMYVLSIALTSILPVLREYEKGAFGVPAELEDINKIWLEFKEWPVPTWVVEEVENMIQKGDTHETEESTNCRRDLQEEQKES